MPNKPPPGMQGPEIDPWFIIVMVWALVACGAMAFALWAWPQFFPG